MVHYHFGDKDGLYEAVLAETIGPAMNRLAAYAESAGTPDVHGLVRMYLATLAANPWLPQLILREVFADGGRLRERFIQGFASRGSRLLTDMIRHGQAAGRLRADLDPARAAMSLLAMCLFPFIAHGVTREVFGFRTDDASLDAYAAHVVRLFNEGVSA
jgi:AcrR family transcriptional regulator